MWPLSSVIAPRPHPSGHLVKQLSAIPCPDIHKLTAHRLCKGAQAEADWQPPGIISQAPYTLCVLLKEHADMVLTLQKVQV